MNSKRRMKIKIQEGMFNWLVSGREVVIDDPNHEFVLHISLDEISWERMAEAIEKARSEPARIN